jgi:16S rRNA (guanine(966)-N(2))-methyltransferase RsmD
VRIISGKNKGRKIIAPLHLPVRPTTDFAKEALFNILVHHTNIEGIEVLDLFAGSGNIAYEFISRNAQYVTAVDNNINCTKFIQQTADKLNYKNLFVIRTDCKAFINHTEMKWDLIFADPPYDMEGVESLPDFILEKHLLKPGGMLIIEHKKSIQFNHLLHFSDHRIYGNVNFSFFKVDK